MGQAPGTLYGKRRVHLQKVWEQGNKAPEKLKKGCRPSGLNPGSHFFTQQLCQKGRDGAKGGGVGGVCESNGAV